MQNSWLVCAVLINVYIKIVGAGNKKIFNNMYFFFFHFYHFVINIFDAIIKTASVYIQLDVGE